MRGSTQAMFDVVFFDAVGMEYTEETAETGALGGSELETIILASELSHRGMSVLVESRRTTGLFEVLAPSGTTYRQLGHQLPIQTKTLIVMRYSRIPTHITYEKLIIWLHDIPSKGEWWSYPDTSEKADIVCVSRWHADLFPESLSVQVIPNMLPPFNYEMVPAAKVPGRFHYASGAMKGLEKTLALWMAFYPKMKTLREDPELHVFTPAWSSVEAGVKESGIVFRGAVTPTSFFLSEMSKSEGMFYVNELPENFCLSAAQTELFGGRVHMLCVNSHFGRAEGGVLDTLSRPEWVTTDPHEFEEKFFAALSSAPTVEGRKPGFHPDTIMPTWLRLLS